MAESVKRTYKVLVGFCIASGTDVYPDDEVELTDREATPFLNAGRLQLVETRDPKASNREPKAVAPKPARVPKITRATKKK